MRRCQAWKRMKPTFGPLRCAEIRSVRYQKRTKLAVAGRMGPSAQSPHDRDANAERVLAGAPDAEGSGVNPPRRPLDRLPDDRPGHPRRRSVRRRPAHGEDSCSRAGSPLCLSEASPLTRGDLGVVSPWRARRGGGVSDYRVLRDFAFEGKAYEAGDVLRQGQSGRGEDHERVAMAELLHGRDDAHPDTRTCTPTAEAGLASRRTMAPALRGDPMPERIEEPARDRALQGRRCRVRAR